MTTPEARFARWRTTAFTVWALIGILILIAALLWGLGKIAGALVPFVIAFVIVFVLNWPVRVLSDRGMSRGVATIVCFVIALAVVGLLATLFGPPIGRQIVAFANDAPKYLQEIEQFASRLELQFSGLAFPAWLVALVNSASSSLSSIAVGVGNDVAHIVVSTGSGVATALFDFVIALVIAFWALKDLPKIREEVVALAGPRHEADAEHLIGTVTRVVGGYLKGQTIASLTTGTLATIGLAIFHVPYALVLGLITFVFNYVPYVGPFTAGLIAGLVGLFVSPLTALIAIGVTVAAQQITDTFVTPRVMSDQVDLHPTLVIFSLLVGGTLFGIPGMLFAIPIAATGKGLFVYYYELQTQRQLGTENGALFRAGSCDPDAESDDAECQPADKDDPRTSE